MIAAPNFLDRYDHYTIFGKSKKEFSFIALMGDMSVAAWKVMTICSCHLIFE